MNAGRLRPYYYIAAGVVLQGLSPVLTKLLLGELTPATVVGARYLIAVFFLLPFGWRHSSPHEHVPPRPRDWVALVLVGALGSGLASLLFTHAIDMTSAGIATALSKTAPIFVAFFAYFTLRERVTSARLLLVLLMVAADVLIGVGEIRVGGDAGQRLLGDILAVSAGALRALAEVLSKTSLRRFYPSTVALWRFGVGCLVTATIAVISGDYRALYMLDSRAWGLLIVLGALCTSLSMTLYYRGLREIPAHVGVSLRLLSAIVTVLVSWLVLGEALNALHISGIAILVAGAYLIVVRTTHQPALREGLAEVRPPPRVTATQTMKGRVAVMVGTMIALTVTAATMLSVQHTWSVLNDQVKLTMVKTATMILQLRGVAQPPSPETYRQYLERVVNQSIAGRFYSVDIMYLVVLDGQRNIIAFAKQSELDIRDPYGRPLPPYSPAMALRLMELSESGVLKRNYDIVPLSAELTQGGQVIGVVKMGSRRSVARRAATDIALRNMSLAVLLIIVGVFIAYRLTDYLARPLEDLSSAVRRIARGELDVPLVPLGSTEVASLGVSVSRMTEDLRQARMVRETLAQMACPAAHQEGRLAAVSMLVRFSGQTYAEQEQQLQTLLNAISRNEGRLAAIAPGHVLAVFGTEEPEQDDVLRAVVAALEWRSEWVTRPQDPPAAALVDWAERTQTAAERVQTMSARLPDEPGAQIPIFVSESAAQAAGAHLQLSEPVHGGLRLVMESTEGLSSLELAEEVDV